MREPSSHPRSACADPDQIRQDMDIDLKTLRAAIAAEVNRREFERADAARGTEGPARPERELQDIVRAFEPVDLEPFLPEPPPVAEPVVQAAGDAAAEVRARGLYNKLRNSPLGKYLGHPRVMGLLMRARERPGGATLRNVVILVVRAIVLRIPGLNRLAHIVSALRRLPERLAALEYQAADSSARLRSVALQTQDQVNQGLYTHALAAQQNTECLLHRLQRLEQRVREHHALVTFAPAEPGQPCIEAAPALMPADLYVDFEARFRGSSEQIRQRLEANLPRFRAVAMVCPEPVLDLGCGRGEWLQLLSEAGIAAIGVDSNPSMVQQCTDAGLQARVGDALEYLSALPDNSLAGLTAFHVIEHLPLDVLIRLVDQARRVVRPGGIVLFETPNPENLIVGACNFYTDPTHRNPLPPALVGFLLEARGFVRVEIDRRHPADPTLRLQGQDSQVTEPLNRLLFGPQDYAAIGYAP